MSDSSGAQFEAYIAELLAHDGLVLGPVRFARDRGDVEERGLDGVLRARVEGAPPERRFAFECKAEWTRKSRSEAIARLRRRSEQLQPLLIAPFWSERDLEELRKEGVSAVDISGNGLLVDRPSLFVLRTGAKKRGKLVPATPRLSIYSSENAVTLVPRIFFSQRVFPTTTAVLEACQWMSMPLAERAPPLTLPTVSKALKTLDEDLVTDRRGRERRLRDPTRLLEYLQRGFRLPAGSPMTFKTRVSEPDIWTRLRQLRPDVRFVVTGRGSAGRYTGLAGPERVQLYVSDVKRVQEALEARPTQAFPNLELTETHEEAPFFDAREEDGVAWSSPVQCYLELSRPESDPRERDVADRLRTGGRFA